MDKDARRILIINGKGGCGKTTIATNLAVAYAANDVPVALLDNDPQASSSYWSQQRDPKLPEVFLLPSHQRSHMYETQAFRNRLPALTKRIVVDGHTNTRERDLDLLFRQTDVILIPILPSAIDMRAGERFLTDLLTHRAYRTAPRPIGVIANRVQPNTETHKQLQHFLQCLDIPTVATFRDSPVYTRAAESGQGVVDMKDCRAARKEAQQWWQLLRWIDEQPKAARATVADIRGVPRSARRARDEEVSQEADSA